MKEKLPNVYPTMMHGTKCYVMDGRYHGGKREYFETKDLALGRAQIVFKNLFKHGSEIAAIPQTVLHDVKKGIEIIEPLGGNLLKACEHYAEFLKSKTCTTKVNDACALWIVQKEKEGLTKSSITNHKGRLKSFCNEFGGLLIHEVDRKRAHAWIYSLPLSDTSKADYRKTCAEFFDWCLFVQEWIAANPFDRIEIKIKRQAEVQILSIPKAKELFLAAKRSDADIFRYVVLCMFCGLRPESEAMSVTREDILKTGEIKVFANKTGKPRYVKMEEGVYKLLIKKKWKGTSVESNFLRRWNEFRYDLGYKIWIDPRYLVGRIDSELKREPWPRNVMRHSYCSYHLALFENEARTVHLSGHSIKTFRKYYLQSIPRSEAKKYWDLIRK